MERSNLFKATIFLLFSLFIIEISNYSYLRNFLLSECNTISYLISKHCGLSSELMTFLHEKNYDFSYAEDNKNKVGDIVYYMISYDYQSFYLVEKKITIEQAVVLGSFL